MSKRLLNPGRVQVVGSKAAEAWCYDERDGLRVYVNPPGYTTPIILRITPGTLRQAIRGARPGKGAQS